MSVLPLVSVIIPSFNSARYIRSALYSVSVQVYANIQIVLVDDGSDDDTDLVVKPFLDPARDIYIRNERNRGVAAALNTAIQSSSGGFLARFDADDYMHAWRIHDQIKFFGDFPDIDMVGTGADLMGHVRGSYNSPRTHKDIVNAFLTGNPMIHPTVAFRRKLVDEGLFRYDETLPTEEDYELWSRILPKIQAANIDRRLIKYRIHESNNQRHPSKGKIKERALRQFLGQWGSFSDELVYALADFQCSGFITYHSYQLMREYASEAGGRDWPRLGWLHDKILDTRSYAEFMWVARRVRR